jgi:hypothetical protein
MSNALQSSLHQEWLCLQNQYDSYEKFSLIIKLVSVVLTSLMLFVAHIGVWAIPLVCILWLQDGIWKTFQNRIGERLFVLEKAIVACTEKDKESQAAEQAMQFNSAWLASRLGSLSLVKEYAAQSCKPTVAYPHVALLMLCFFYIYVI